MPASQKARSPELRVKQTTDNSISAQSHLQNEANFNPNAETGLPMRVCRCADA
jgi:hypothetical protein